MGEGGTPPVRSHPVPQVGFVLKKEAKNGEKSTKIRLREGDFVGEQT